jgi:hypothetical protein
VPVTTVPRVVCPTSGVVSVCILFSYLVFLFFS